jgi:hypothetical protein
VPLVWQSRERALELESKLERPVPRPQAAPDSERVARPVQPQEAAQRVSRPASALELPVQQPALARPPRVSAQQPARPEQLAQPPALARQAPPE